MKEARRPCRDRTGFGQSYRGLGAAQVSGFCARCWKGEAPLNLSAA
jgi:hypothetical protein